MRRGLGAAAVVSVTLALLGQPAAAFHTGHSSCTFSAGTVRLHLAAEHVVRLLVVDGQIKYADLTDYSHRGACGAARVGNTNRILVDEARAGASRLQFDQQLGRFGPGATTETAGRSEIEVHLGTLQDMWIMGRRAGERITLGERGVNLNADRDVDLVGQALRDVSVFAGEGEDRVSGQGGAGTGEAFTSHRAGLIVYGGTGADVLIGSDLGDVLEGDDGRDRVYGRRGGDDLDGGPHADVVLGGSGKDLVSGGGAADRVEAGPQDDIIFARDYAPDDLHGGTGNDRAFVDSSDSMISIETKTFGDP